MRRAIQLCAAFLGLGAAISPTPADEPKQWRIEPVRAIYAHFNEGRFLRLSGVYYDRDADELLYCDASGHRVGIADRRGVPVYSFGSKTALRSPARLIVDPDGRILVADQSHDGIYAFDYDGTPLPELRLDGVPAGAERPRFTALALSDDDRLYLADQANHRIVVVELDGSFVRAFEAPPERPELLQSIVDLELAPTGELVASDATGLAVQVYAPDGRFLRGWGEHEIGPENFSLPGGLAVDEAGRIFVADTLRQQVKIFSSEGALLFAFGGPGIGRGRFGHPVDLASDRKGRLFVTERSGKRVQVFEIAPVPAP